MQTSTVVVWIVGAAIGGLVAGAALTSALALRFLAPDKPRSHSEGEQAHTAENPCKSSEDGQAQREANELRKVIQSTVINHAPAVSWNNIAGLEEAKQVGVCDLSTYCLLSPVLGVNIKNP